MFEIYRMLHSNKIFYLRFHYTEPCCVSKKQKILLVFLLLHNKTI